MKLVVNTDNDQLLGAHMVGPEAAEILLVSVQIGLLMYCLIENVEAGFARFCGITMLATHAPGRICLGYSRKYCECPKLG